MFKGRRFAITNPVKPKWSPRSRVSRRPSSSSSSGRRSSTWSDSDRNDNQEDENYNNIHSTVDSLEHLAEIAEEDSTVDGDLISSDEPTHRPRRAKSPRPLRAVYIVSQSNIDILSPENAALVKKRPGGTELCIDKVISVHATKLSANTAAKAHLRKLSGVEDRPSSDGGYKDSDADDVKGDESDEEDDEYHEGIGARGVFVGSMKKQLKRGGSEFVRVETQLWKVET